MVKLPESYLVNYAKRHGKESTATLTFFDVMAAQTERDKIFAKEKGMDILTVFIRHRKDGKFTYYYQSDPEQEPYKVATIPYLPDDYVELPRKEKHELSATLFKLLDSVTGVSDVLLEQEDDAGKIFKYKLLNDIPAGHKPSTPSFEGQKDSKEDKKMATKKATEKAAAKKGKTAEEKPETITLKKGHKKGEKKSGVGSMVREAILAGKSFDETLKAVQKAFPDSKFNNAHWNWYRNDMKQKGEKVPDAPKAEKKAPAKAEVKKEAPKAAEKKSSKKSKK